MKLEAIENKVHDGIAKRNENWEKLNGVLEKVDDLETNKQETKVKISSVEKELNDYQATMATMNPNQEAKQKATGYGTISLPKNTANGQVSVSVKGQTATNLIENGDFRNGALGWWGRVELSSNGITVTPNGNYSGVNVVLKPNTVTNSKVYINFDMVTSNSDYEIYASDNVTFTLRSKASLMSEAHKSVILSIGETGFDIDIGVRNKINDDLRPFIINNLKVINLTQTFGAGNEPSKEECDVIFSNYFDGTKSTVSASRLKSVGKNLLNTKKPFSLYTSYKITNTGYIREASVGGDIIYHIKTTKNLQYVVTGETVRGGARYRVKDTITGEILLPLGSISRTGRIFMGTGNIVEITFNTSSSDLGNTTEVIDIQIEQNAAATPYEPYTESTSYLPNVGELRSLPNGVKDEVRVSGGKAEHIQRTKKYVLQASDISAIVSHTNCVDVRTKTPLLSDAKSGTNYVDGLYSINGLSEISLDNRDRAENISKHFFVTSDGRLSLFMPLGTTLAQAQSALTGLELTYQLAEPIITPINVSGNLISYPSGTVYVEQVVADAGLYTTKMDILNTDLPIKTLDKLSKVDYTTGVEHSLDVSKAVVTAQSFTHPDLTMGDIVFFEYYYDLESTNGYASVEYYDSRYTVKDSVTNKFYKWSITIANGVPTIETVEV